ncbi:MAG: hypothetical protein JSS74_06500 [Actinobacteria bacterium]|nr:hypothetical protein [Actinomycetota bacterium]
MTTLIWPAPVAAPSANAAQRTRSAAGILCAIGYFCSSFIESVVSTVDGDASPAAQLAHIKTNLPQIGAQVLFEYLTPLFLLGLAFAMVSALRHRGAWLGSLGAALAAIGAVAGAAGASVHLVCLTLITAGAPDVAATSILSAQLPDALFFGLFAAPIALLVFAGAAWRARVTSWIPFAMVAVYLVLEFSGIVPELVPVVLGLVAYLIILWPLVRDRGE